MPAVSNDSDPLIPQRRRKAALRAILKEMLRGDPAVGLRKPERLGHNLAGLWSRRLSQRDRLVYRFDDERIYIFAIGGHHDEK
jgi:toxin YoeB